MIRIKRTYEPAERGDGRRLLVERLWPRGMKKAELVADAWLKDVAPSTELRRWFDHREERWDEFQRRYRRELDANRAAWEPILDASRRGTVTLLYSAHDVRHNGALVLRDYLDAQRAAGASNASAADSTRRAKPKRAASTPERGAKPKRAASERTRGAKPKRAASTTPRGAKPKRAARQGRATAPRRAPRASSDG